MRIVVNGTSPTGTAVGESDPWTLGLPEGEYALIPIEGIDPGALAQTVERFERTLRVATDNPIRTSDSEQWDAYQRDVNALLEPARLLLVAFGAVGEG